MKTRDTLIGWIAKVARRLWRGRKTQGDNPTFNHGSVVMNQHPERLTAELATDVWRLRKRLGDLGVDALPQLRSAAREADELLDALAHVGVEVFDPTGSPFDPRQSVKVLAFQSTPGLEEARVIETVRPTVYLRSRWIQTAEVIVGTPIRSPHTPGDELARPAR